MENEIISITEKVQQETKLPNGHYIGIYGGNEIEISYKGKDYIIHVNEGVRGIGFRVVAHIEDDNIDFKYLLN